MIAPSVEPKASKIFFETSVILGAAQYELLTTESSLKTYTDDELLQKPDRYKDSKELIDFVLKNRQRLNLEPFASYMVRSEIRKLLDEEQMRKKIVGRLRIDDKIKLLPEDDRKIFDLILYKIFFIKFPKITLELVDSFSSKSIDTVTCEYFRDDVFHQIYKPLLQRYKYLRTYFEQSGETKEKLMADPDWEEYSFLVKVSDPFQKFRDYRKINDIFIFGEAVAAYDWMKNNLKEIPDFYFISCDHIFVPFKTESRKLWKKVSEDIQTKYGIIVGSPRYILNKFSNTVV